MNLISAINNSALYANRAEKDASGRTITETYLTAVPSEYVTNDELTATLKSYPNLTAMSDFVYSAVESATSSLPTSSDLDKKLDTSAFTAYTADADVTQYSASANIDITDHTISGKDWTNTITASADAASANAVSVVEGKFSADSSNKITGYNGSAFAGEKYTAGNGIAITNNEISVSGKYVTSAGDSLSSKMLVLKDNVWMELPDMGGFATANSGASGVPDVLNPSTKIIYLVKDTSVTGADKYNEWICTDTATPTFEKIGDTSINLSDYVATATTATDKWDVVAYSGKDGISVANHEIGLSSDYVTAIQQVSGKLDETTFNTFTASADVSAYSAGANIDITNHVVSGKDWTTEIQTASSDAVTEVGSKFATSSDGTNTYITAYDGTAFYSPDVSQFLTKASADTIYLTKTSADTLYQPIITFAGLTAED